jgi:hypothetical protein
LKDSSILASKAWFGKLITIGDVPFVFLIKSSFSLFIADASISADYSVIFFRALASITSKPNGSSKNSIAKSMNPSYKKS